MTQFARSRLTLPLIGAIALVLLPVSTQAQSSDHLSADLSTQRLTESSFETQPTGTYRYTAGLSNGPREAPDRTWILRKSGSAVIGIALSGDRTPDRTPNIGPDRTPNIGPDRTPNIGPDRTPNIGPDRTRVLHCLRGQAAGDRIIRITQVSPPYTPAANWESQQTLDLAPLTRQSPSPITTPAEQAALVECIQAFWR